MVAPATAPVTTAPSLLVVSLAHEYFGGGFPEHATTPLPATTASCRRLGLRLIHNGANLTLYAAPAAVAKLGSAAYQAALATETLCWQITPRTADFAAFTAVDFVGNRQCLVFTNTDKGAKGGSLTVSAKASAKDVWTRQLLRYDFRPTRPLKAGTVLSLQNNFGTVLRSLTVTDPSLVAVDASDFGSGLYQLAQGARVLAKWFADERPFPPTNTGALLVLPGKLLAAAFARTVGRGASAATPPTYTANYAARSVIWRYHVFNAQADETLSIATYTGEGLPTAPAARSAKKSNASKPSRAAAAPFEPYTDAALPDAKSFAAVRPLKLARLPAQRYALNSGGATRYAPLPLAGLAFARSASDDALCSDIFVYL